MLIYYNDTISSSSGLGTAAGAWGPFRMNSVMK